MSVKRGKHHATELLNKNNSKNLSAVKKQDVNNLMKKKFGDDWSADEEFRWYKNLLKNEAIMTMKMMKKILFAIVMTRKKAMF